MICLTMCHVHLFSNLLASHTHIHTHMCSVHSERTPLAVLRTSNPITSSSVIRLHCVRKLVFYSLNIAAVIGFSRNIPFFEGQCLLILSYVLYTYTYMYTYKYAYILYVMFHGRLFYVIFVHFYWCFGVKFQCPVYYSRDSQ